MTRKRRVTIIVLASTLILSLACLSIIPIRIAIARSRYPQPQAILVLSGNPDRVTFAANFALNRPGLDIWYTTGFEFGTDWRPFIEAGIAKERIHLDSRARDTVSNFTSLAGDFKRLGLHNIYLITSDYHMRRARAIAAIVLGSRGIAVTPLPVPSNKETETLFHALRDVGRSFFWLVTGHTGASLHDGYGKM